LISVCLVC